MTFTGNMRKALVLLLCLAALDCAGSDSTSRATWQLIPRLHTSGYFPFTGALLNRNAIADVNLFFEKKAVGFFIFQSVDLEDRKSYANYLQPGVFGTLHLNPNLRLRGFFGFIFSQTNGFCDSESDYYAAIQANWIITPGIRVENTLLFYDYSINKKLANRLLIEWTLKKFRVSGYLWQRTVLDEKFNSTSGAVALTFPIIRISRKVNLELTSTYMGYLTEAKPDFALRDGFFFTLAMPVSLR